MDVKLTLSVNPAHLDALARFQSMLLNAMDRGIAKQQMLAASGNRGAMEYVDEARAIKRYLDELLGAIAYARECHFSQEGNDNAKG